VRNRCTIPPCGIIQCEYHVDYFGRRGVSKINDGSDRRRNAHARRSHSRGFSGLWTPTRMPPNPSGLTGPRRDLSFEAWTRISLKKPGSQIPACGVRERNLHDSFRQDPRSRSWHSTCPVPPSEAWRVRRWTRYRSGVPALSLLPPLTRSKMCGRQPAGIRFLSLGSCFRRHSFI
jgi:hypothetical protein